MAWTRQGHPATRPVSTGKHAIFSEVTTNNSDKVFEVGVDCKEGLLYIKRIRVELAATSTVGNRVLSYRLEDGAGDVLASQSGHGNDVIAASATGIVEFAEFAIRQGAQSPGNEVRENLLVGLVLSKGMKLRVWDAAAIDAAADDMVVYIATKVLE